MCNLVYRRLEPSDQRRFASLSASRGLVTVFVGVFLQPKLFHRLPRTPPAVRTPPVCTKLAHTATLCAYPYIELGFSSQGIY